MSVSILSRTSLRRTAVAVAGLTATSVLLTATSAQAAPAERPAQAAPVAVTTDDEALGRTFEEALRIIDALPEEVLAEGEEATVRWLEAHGRGTATADGTPVLYAFNLGGCARGIALAVGSNIFAIAKVYKVKKAIDKLGGVTKVIQKIQSKKKKGKTFKKGIMEVFEEAGGGIGAIAAEILGIDGVIKNCW
ncbi:hypothetical protein [Streptomyces sp. NPDC007094]|uniref:hypothetical protein n=1 Tax=Streptomyces sp. NPDC007094 TaxID=3155359 RepID=UPI0033EDDB82